MVEILYQDRWMVIVQKPAGTMVHPSELAPDRDTMVSRVRGTLKTRVWPIHRLDRPTAGLLMFALSEDAGSQFGQLFQNRLVTKRYLALVRGFCEPVGRLDYPIARDKDHEKKDAVTSWRRLATIQIPIAMGKFPSVRYSLVEVFPETGRFHQIRKHFHHMSNPLVGDTKHGDGRHNRLFRDHFQCTRLCLSAVGQGFTHPFTGEEIQVTGPVDTELAKLYHQLGLQPVLEKMGLDKGNVRFAAEGETLVEGIECKPDI